MQQDAPSSGLGSELSQLSGELNSDFAAIVDADAEVLDDLLVHVHEKIRSLAGAEHLHVVCGGLDKKTPREGKRTRNYRSAKTCVYVRVCTVHDVLRV